MAKRPTCIPDYDAPRRVITAEESRRSGFPQGTEVTAAITSEELEASGAIRLYRPR